MFRKDLLFPSFIQSISFLNLAVTLYMKVLVSFIACYKFKMKQVQTQLFCEITKNRIMHTCLCKCNKCYWYSQNFTLLLLMSDSWSSEIFQESLEIKYTHFRYNIQLFSQSTTLQKTQTAFLESAQCFTCFVIHEHEWGLPDMHCYNLFGDPGM